MAQDSGTKANDGGKIVKETVSKMKQIAEAIKASAQGITKLNDSSKKIGEIISVIDDIADQTNLLSLNAAIEAARAGEQGRGFAVVADSVGKLAVSTAGATKEITNMIRTIQKDTDDAVNTMKRGTKEVQSGIELAEKSGDSLEEILSASHEHLEMVNHIAAASDEQSAAAEQIAKNISSISDATSESARSAQEVATTVNELTQMTETLTQLVSQFKIEEVYSSGSNRLLGK
jgi:methyl-accepting chemotaxis protein